VEVVDFKFSALGAEAFLPDTKTASVAGFSTRSSRTGRKFSFSTAWRA
jgi:hypothetical protein